MRLRRILVGILSFVILVGTVVGIGRISFADDLNDAEKERQQLEARKQEIESQLKDLEGEKDDLLTSIEKLDGKMEEVNGRLEQVQGELKEATLELQKLEAAYEKAVQTEDNQYETMKKRVKYMYENGSEGYLDIILSSKSVGEFLNRVEYINKITAYDNQMLNNYEDTKNDVEQKRAAAQLKQEQYNTLLEEVQLEKDSLETMSQTKQKKLKEYNTAIENNEEAAKAYAEEIEKKEEEINQLLLKAAKESGSGSVGVAVTDGYIWPLAVKGTITSHFGKRSAPTAGASTYHKGTDIAAPQGTDIYAVADGTVTTATYSSSAGNYVMINHGNGVYTAYMHASKLHCQVGDKVYQGDTIAEVGSTGISTGAHLHISFIINGEYVDPEDYLPQAGAD